MERYKASSQVSIDKRSNATKDSSILSVNKHNQAQNEIDNLIEHGILESIYKYDSKLDFIYAPIISLDQVIKQTRRQTCGLIWNSIRSPMISKLVYDGHYCGFVEILQTPKEWSRYDTDLLLLKVRHKNFLNGLALRDEFVRVLKIILKRDFNEEINTEKKYSYELKDVDFTRNMIQLVFNNRYESELTLIISLILLVEFDISCIDFFHDTYTSLCNHNDFNDYLKYHPDVNRTRLTPYNSIKFLFDYSLMEANLCEYLLQKSSPLSSMLTGFLKLRKEWLKYVQRASKYASDTIKMQIHSEKHRQSTCSVNSIRSGTSNTSTMHKITQNKIPLSTEIEVAFEFLFSISLLRLLFITVCTKYKQFGASYENDIAYAIEKALQLFGDALENNYLEHPFLKNVNFLPDCLLTHEISASSALLCRPPMTESYLTTDIIVIIVLVVVLILIGACAFFTHFYWTKIGVAEIWNTAKWSSMRSSFYNTMRRFSAASTNKFSSERPFSAESAYSDDPDGSALPAPLRNKKSNLANPSNIQSSSTLPTQPKSNNIRQASSNQVQPVSVVSYNKSGRTNYATKIGQSPENTKIHNIHEDDDRHRDGSVVIETNRF
ncbi:unnamed protein product [Rotaria sp. Silwood1]|nr:unnamed protein product [Rotaria sp. Silwood1]CAF1297959.1 unnamed protein product [Rotaria sp. Silwood1]CAF3547080.1 unnamed protein product [Rotaria sp. Silwood1]